MNQNLHIAAREFTAFVLLGDAFLSFVAGISLIKQLAIEIFAGLFLIGCAFFLLRLAIRIYLDANKERKVLAKQLAEAGRQKANGSAAQILAAWSYSKAEWRRFTMWEQKEAVIRTITETVLMLVSSIGIVHFLFGSNWMISIAFGLTSAFLYGLLKSYIIKSAFQCASGTMQEVIITKEGIIVNGSLNRFYGLNFWLEEVSLKETRSFNLLEICYCWNTRHGITQQELRVPIPKGCLKEAIQVQELLIQNKETLQSSN